MSTLHRRGTDDVIHSKESSKFNQGCTICRSCHWTTSVSSGLKWRENGIKWREFGSHHVRRPQLQAARDRRAAQAVQPHAQQRR